MFGNMHVNMYVNMYVDMSGNMYVDMFGNVYVDTFGNMHVDMRTDVHKKHNVLESSRRDGTALSVPLHWNSRKTHVGVKVLTYALALNTSLTVLDLRLNEIGDAGATDLARLLEGNPMFYHFRRMFHQMLHRTLHRIIHGMPI